MRSNRIKLFVLTTCIVAAGCGSDPSPSTGNNSSVGGSVAKGGSSATGGSSSVGGSSATSSQTQSSGGAASSSKDSGSAEGGAPASGGASSKGGSEASVSSSKARGGSPAAGGSANTSIPRPNAGFTAVGTTKSGGGSASTGPTTGAAGRASGNAGAKATGGAPPAAGGSTASNVAGGSAVGVGGGTPGECPAVSEFDSWPAGKGPLDIGKLAVTNFKPHTGDAYGGAGYAWTFAYFGSLQFTKEIGDTTNNDYLISKFDCNQAGPSNTSSSTVDDRAFGDLPLEIYLEKQTAACKTLGLARADTQVKNISTDARYWIDDMYMITGLQVFAYRATKDSKYLDLAAKTMLSYFDALQQSDGLFWHTKQSKAYWGRANGWVASGMAEILQELPTGDTRDKIMAGYKKQMDGLLPLQITSGGDAGCWRQVLNVSDANAESSCTAMFTYALVTGIKNGWLTDAKYITAARNGWTALAAKTSSSGMLDKVCPGTGQANAGDLASQQKFYTSITLGSNDQHGQAPLLWAARALLRTDCPGKR